jgi:hypothetical protein
VSALPAELPEPAAETRRCGCCQKIRTGYEELAVFGVLTSAAGVTWDLCGKCIQVLWRKRAPRPEVIPV